MKIRVEITKEPLMAREAGRADGGIGAVVEFAGIVRRDEDGASISALHYEAYEAMAKTEMERIVGELAARFPCQAVEVVHRIGRVPVGEASIIVRAEAKHRAEAFGMLAELMNRLKQDVPIWKKVVP